MGRYVLWLSLESWGREEGRRNERGKEKRNTFIHLGYEALT